MELINPDKMFTEIIIEEIKSNPDLNNKLREQLTMATLNPEVEFEPGTSYYSPEETAERIGVSYQTVLNMTRDGRLNCLRYGKAIFISEIEIDSKMKAGIIRTKED